MSNTTNTFTTIRQGIMSDEQVRNVVAEIENLPQSIAAQKDTLADLDFQLNSYTGVELAKEELKLLEDEAAFEVRQESDAAKAQLADIEKRYLDEVTAAVDDDGKPQYKNATQRTAAVKQLVANDPDYHGFQQLVANNEEQRIFLINRKLTQDAEWRKAVERVKEAEAHKLDLRLHFEKARSQLSFLYESMRGYTSIANMIGGLSREHDEYEMRHELESRDEALRNIAILAKGE